MTRCHLLGVMAFVACAGGAASEGRTSPLTAGRRDEVITIGAHNEITHVAAGERLVFAATQRGVIVYDALFRAWLPPFARGDDQFRMTATALAADPTEDAVWVGTPGNVIYYRPRLDYAISATVPGRPDEIFFDRRDLGAGAYVRLGTRYVRVPRGNVGMYTAVTAVPPPEQRVGAATARDVFRQYPSVETFLPLLTRGDDLEQWPVSAATLAPGRSEVWLGTGGNGLLRVDPTFNRAEHFPFGLLERGVGALALAADGVWSGGLGAAAERGGLVFASSDLQRWRWLDGPPSRPFFGTRVNVLSIRERTAWIGTSRGLLRMELDDDNRMERWDAADGLPSDIVTSVAAGVAGTWVGTTAGLAFVERLPRAVGPGIAVRDLVLLTDTLWIASDAGVLALAPPDSIPRRLSVADARLTRAVAAIAKADSVLAVASDAELIEIDLIAGQVLPPRAASFAALRRIVRMAMDAHTIWLAGEGGVLVIHRATGRSALLAVGITVPAAATDVALARDFAWIGTRDGLVRVRRRGDGMPP
jgi:ligand-binding sensor domain-containing protein